MKNASLEHDSKEVALDLSLKHEGSSVQAVPYTPNQMELPRAQLMGFTEISTIFQFMMMKSPTLAGFSIAPPPIQTPPILLPTPLQPPIPHSLSRNIVGRKKNSYKDAPKLITCPVAGCNQKFPWNSSLKRHILTHTRKSTD